MDIMLLVSTVGILAAVVFIVYYAYQGYSPILLAPIATLIACATSKISVTDGFIKAYASGFGKMGGSMLLMYTFAAMFANVLTKDKAAFSIAEWISKIFGYKHAAMVIMLITGFLCLGGLHVGCYFIVFPIALALFSQRGYSKDLILGCILAGSWTWCLCAPLSPSPHNTIAINILGTTPSAGLIPGLAAAIFILVACCVYLEWQGQHWLKQGRKFDAWDEIPEANEEEKKTYPPIIRAIIPCIVLLLLYNLGGLNVAVALGLSTLLAIALEYKTHDLRGWFKVLQEGLLNGLEPLCNLAFIAGFGAVVAMTPFYKSIINWVSHTTIHPYILALFGCNLVAFCLGSAGSALSTVLPNVLPLYQDYVQNFGLDMGNLHRLSVIGSIGLDSLPHNGSIIACCKLFNTTPKKSYFPVFICCTVITIIAGFAIALPLAMMGFK